MFSILKSSPGSIADTSEKSLSSFILSSTWCIIAIDKVEARKKLAELSPKLKREFFLTTLAIFDEPVDNSRKFSRERENWEKIIQHRQGFTDADALNVNVLVDFPETYSSDDNDHLQGLIKYWNDLTQFLETALNVKVHLFQLEFETEMREPTTIFRSNGERKANASPNREVHEPSQSELTNEKDPENERDDKDSDNDDDKELDDSNFDVYWNI
jgi:hypothetical protein